MITNNPMEKNSTESFSREVSTDEHLQVLKELDVYGFSRMPGFLQQKALAGLLTLTEDNYNRINTRGKIAYAGTPERDKDDKILYNLQNIDLSYIDLLVSPAVTAIASVKLNDPHYRFLPADVPNYVLQYYNARSSGQKLDLHIDSHIPFMGNYTSMMQFVFLLEDSNEENGCTVVVPGSHKSGQYTDRELKNVVPLTGKAGDLVLWDSRIWHGTLENISGKSRWGLIATMSMWWVKPSMDIVRAMNNDIYQQCSDQQKQLLGFCAVPPVDPFERNNTKCGYEFLKPSIKDYNF
jgi:hypothetical protein